MDFFLLFDVLYYCCQVLHPAVVQGGTAVDRPPSLARRRSPVAAAVARSLARPLSFDRPPPLLSSLLPRADNATPEVCAHVNYIDR